MYYSQDKVSSRRRIFLLISLLVNVVLITSFVYYFIQTRMEKSEPKDNRKHFFAYYLSFDSIQCVKLDSLNKETDLKLRSLGLQMRNLKKDLETDLSVHNGADSMNLYELCLKFIPVHAQIRDVNYQYYLQVRDICNPEQINRLDRLYETTTMPDSLVLTINK